MSIYDKLIGAKFLFDKELMNYPDLVKLFEENGFNTKFIQKPITDNLEVHSIYIKPELEIAYLVKSPTADDYYETAGYSCITFKEFEFKYILDILGYKPHVKTNENQKIKKSKYITLEKDDAIITINKKKIDAVYYDNETNLMSVVMFNTNRTYSKTMEIQEYQMFIDELNS